jgi:Gpi18-like mannosyltransferase
MEVDMLLRKKLLISDRKILLNCTLVIGFLLAFALRVSLYHVETSDYTLFVSQWYDFIRSHGFAAFKSSFSNYNVPYLYLLGLTTCLPIPKLVAIKTLSVVFDMVLGIFTYLIISLRYKRSYAAIIGALVILLAPTIFINSAAWGQADATYTAFCLGSLYFLLRGRPAWACVFFGLAISFKLQAIFFAPVLLVLLLKRRLPLKYLVILPVIFLLLLVPAFIAGRDAQSLLTIYIEQASTGGVGGAGQFNAGGVGPFNGGDFGQSHGVGTGQPNSGGPGSYSGRGTQPFNGNKTGQFNGRGGGGSSFSSSSLTWNAPNFYQWLPADAAGYWKWIGIALAALVVVLVSALIVASKKELTPAIILKTTLVFALAIPFLLPEMHERYFYLADVVSIVYAFYFPRRFYVAIIMQLCSLLSYAPYFYKTQYVSLAYVAVAVLVLIIVVMADLVLTLYPNIKVGSGRNSLKGMIGNREVNNSVAKRR